MWPGVVLVQLFVVFFSFSLPFDAKMSQLHPERCYFILVFEKFGKLIGRIFLCCTIFGIQFKTDVKLLTAASCFFDKGF